MAIIECTDHHRKRKFRYIHIFRQLMMTLRMFEGPPKIMSRWCAVLWFGYLVFMTFYHSFSSTLCMQEHLNCYYYHPRGFGVRIKDKKINKMLYCKFLHESKSFSFVDFVCNFLNLSL